jgi:hypothetical protein
MNLDDLAILERRHVGTHVMPRDNVPTDIDVSVKLEFQRDPNRCHMVVVNNGYAFLNTAFNVCNWPVQEWTLDRVREFLKIFEEEYVPMCVHFSVLTSDVKYPPVQNVYHISHKRGDEADAEGYYPITSSKTTDIKRSLSDEDDAALLIWQTLVSEPRNLGQKPRISPVDAEDDDMNEYWDTWRLNEKFGVCEFMMDISYEEAIFPFQDASDGMRKLVRNRLKTLWDLSLTSGNTDDVRDEPYKGRAYFETPNGLVLIPSAFCIRSP